MIKIEKIIKYGWWVLIIIPLAFAFGVYINNDYKITNEKAEKLVEIEIPENQINSACSKENVDWDIAVDALTKHYADLKRQNPNEEIDGGPAEIERHFAENCEEDLKIYDKYLASYDWVGKFFNNRIKELVGVEKYEDIIKNYTQPKKFSGCESYMFADNKARADEIYSIREMMEEKKYKEVITLSDKYTKDSEVWYCDSIFWAQRAKAFYNLNNCPKAIIEAAHAFAVAPEDNENDESQREFYFTVLNSNICKKVDTP